MDTQRLLEVGDKVIYLNYRYGELVGYSIGEVTRVTKIYAYVLLNGCARKMRREAHLTTKVEEFAGWRVTPVKDTLGFHTYIHNDALQRVVDKFDTVQKVISRVKVLNSMISVSYPLTELTNQRKLDELTKQTDRITECLVSLKQFTE